MPGAEVPAILLKATDGGEVHIRGHEGHRRRVPRRLCLPADRRAGPTAARGLGPDSGGAGLHAPQSCAFRDSARELAELGAALYGLSSQPLDEQREFAAREDLPYPLLNDSGFRLAEALGLPTFEADAVRHYRRLTFIARRGRIVKVFYPVFPPQENAADVMAWLRR